MFNIGAFSNALYKHQCAGGLLLNDTCFGSGKAFIRKETSALLHYHPALKTYFPIYCGLISMTKESVKSFLIGKISGFLSFMLKIKVCMLILFVLYDLFIIIHE